MRRLFFILTSLASTCFAQTPELDFTKMNSTYENLNSFSCTVEYKYYDSYESSTEVEKMTGNYFIKNGQYRMDLDNSILVSDGTVLLSIDHKLKQIVVSKSPNEQFGTGALNVKQLHRESKKFKNQGITNHSFIYRYDNKQTANSGLCYTDVELNNTTWFVESISTYYKNMSVVKDGKYVVVNPKIKISYSNQKINPELEDSLFNLDTWVIKQNNTYILAKGFKDYDLMVI